MLTLSLDALAEAVTGEIVGEPRDVMVNGLAVDSRLVEPGNLFVAFPGERADGHEHILDAIDRGARAVIVTREPAVIRDEIDACVERGVGIVKVPDALEAVQQLASHHRDRLFCPVVGVTGSTGKTTTKDFLTAVLSDGKRVVSTEGNQNNELGVPLTLMRAGADTDVLIVEMAMRGAGQIASLCEITRPTAGLVTNVGTSHIELLGSPEAIADAKGELVEAIQADGAVFLNGDDARTVALSDRAQAPVTTYGLAEGCDIRATAVRVDEQSRPIFTLCNGADAREVALGVPGRHNVYNALAAAAVALDLGVGLEDIARALEGARSGKMRMQVFESASGMHVINDAYNANPTSMRAAVETLAEMSGAHQRIAVLGDMAELGSLTELAHFRVGEELARMPVDLLVTVGSKASRIADGARAEGMPDDAITTCDTADSAAVALLGIVEPGDAVLVKASRVMGLERVVERIVEPDV
jgi:UDP-N-acetylmuramoyl-tripeptide--D-alanyl-D-alanine ligase